MIAELREIAAWVGDVLLDRRHAARLRAIADAVETNSEVKT